MKPTKPFYKTDTCCAAGKGLGSRIRGFRGFCDMSRGSLAARLNVSEETVAAWEDGQESPTLLQICLMCEFFNTTPNDLLLGPSYVQAGPLLGLGLYMESLPNEAQMAILNIARMCRRTEGEKSPA